MPTSTLLSLKPGLHLERTAAGGVVLQGSEAIALGALPSGLRDALERLGTGGDALEELAAQVQRQEGLEALVQLYYLLERFEQHGLLCRTVSSDTGTLVTLEPLAQSRAWRQQTRAPGLRLVLSRFAYARVLEGHLVLESPRAHARVRIHDSRVAALVFHLSEPRLLDTRDTGPTLLAREEWCAIMELLWGAGFLQTVGEDNQPTEAHEPGLAEWEFHDLLFHARSRMGRHDGDSGATYRFKGLRPPPPVLEPETRGERFPLHSPSAATLEKQDVPFTRVLAERRSVRRFGETPLSAVQLGELLHRVARIRQLLPSERSEVPGFLLSERPYPGGGACYELELYLTLHRCEGLPRGLYHYAPLEHALYRVRDWDEPLERLMGDACTAARLKSPPDVLVTLAARFQRVSWKYEGVAYSVILKDVGVLLHQFYLVATAMGLGTCAIGGGDSDAFAMLAGLDYYLQTSVGELVLGTLPRDR